MEEIEMSEEMLQPRAECPHPISQFLGNLGERKCKDCCNSTLLHLLSLINTYVMYIRLFNPWCFPRPGGVSMIQRTARLVRRAVAAQPDNIERTLYHKNVQLFPEVFGFPGGYLML